MGRKNLGVHTLKPSLRDPVKTFQSQISDKLYYCCALVKAVRAIYNTLLIKHWHFIIKSDIFYRSLQLFLADITLVGLFYFKNQNLHICVLKNLGLHTIHRVTRWNESFLNDKDDSGDESSDKSGWRGNDKTHGIRSWCPNRTFTACIFRLVGKLSLKPSGFRFEQLQVRIMRWKEI